MMLDGLHLTFLGVPGYFNNKRQSDTVHTQSHINNTEAYHLSYQNGNHVHKGSVDMLQAPVLSCLSHPLKLIGDACINVNKTTAAVIISSSLTTEKRSKPKEQYKRK